MKIREVNQKAENLIEQGENAKQRQLHYQQAANSARSQLMAAYARLEAASETDEDGEPVGDVAGAQAEIYAAQAFLSSAESGLMEATHQLEGINQQKLDTVQEIERYESVEERNLSILAQLQQKQFGTNAAAFMADLAARMNSGEQMRQQLLQSMGMSAPGKNYSTGGASGGGIPSAGHAFSDTAYYGFSGQSVVNNPYMTMPTAPSLRDKLLYNYLNYTTQIYNNPNISLEEKRRLLTAAHAEKEKRLAAIDEVDSEQVKAKTRGGNTITKAETPAERYEQLMYEYAEQISRIRNDSNMSVELKQQLINETNVAFRETLQQEGLLETTSLYGGPFSKISNLLSSVQYNGIDREIATKQTVERIPFGTYPTPEFRQKVLDHPRFSGMIELDGKRAYVFGTNDARLNNLQYTQGNNDKGWTQTCALAQIAGICVRTGKEETENSIVSFSFKNGISYFSPHEDPADCGGTAPDGIATILNRKGIPAHYDRNIACDEIANLIESGHGVLVGVNAGYLWNDAWAVENGRANHAISVIGSVRDESTHEVIGFVINDTGRGIPGDQKRIVPISLFSKAYEVPSRAVIATDNPIA